MNALLQRLAAARQLLEEVASEISTIQTEIATYLQQPPPDPPPPDPPPAGP